MKSLLLIILLSSFCFVLSWCSQSNWLSKWELFQLKQECNSSQNEKKAQDIINDSVARFAGRNDLVHTEELREIFYSPERNSCLFSVSAIEIQEWHTCDYYKLYDLYSKEFEKVYLEDDDTWKCDRWKTIDAFNSWLKKFKWI